MPIPHVDVKAQYAPLIPELQEAFARTLETGGSSSARRSSRSSARRPRCSASQETVSCANGTDAIVLVLDALEIGPGDEVVCPAFTFYATAEAIARRGATPVFADIDPVTLNLDPAEVERRSRRRRRRSCRCTSSAGPRRDLERLRAAGDRGRGAGVRRRRDRDEHRLDVQLLPDEEPLRARRRRPDRGQRRRARDSACACCASTAPSRRRSSSTSATTRASTRCRPSFLRIFLKHIDEWNRQRREAAARYTELLDGLVETPVDEGATSTTCIASARPSATALPRR